MTEPTFQQIMANKPLAIVYELVAEAHANIQRDFKHIDPVVGVITKMRTIDIPADAMTIDCLKTNQRILLIFHDEQPEIVNYQFCLRDEDPADEFEVIQLQEVTSQQLYNWMKESFSVLR